MRFFVCSTRDLAVTIRLSDAERVFRTSEAGGEITFADLTRETPRFVEVSSYEVATRKGVTPEMRKERRRSKCGEDT